MNEIFSKNIKAIRMQAGITQERAADLIGVSRSAYGAYEEGRAFPSAETLIRITKAWHITDLIGLISSEKFDVKRQFPHSSKSERPDPLTEVQRAYEALEIREKLCVNILLGLVDLGDPS